MGYFSHYPTYIFKGSKALSILLTFVSAWVKNAQN